MNNILISTDSGLLDFQTIHNFITKSYWAKGRTLEQVKTCAKNTLNFGVYLDNQQIGYARVVTDFTVFAYIMDVFILPQYRANGYGQQLMLKILSHAALCDVETWKLTTVDAHSFYKKYGFKTIKSPENMMERKIVTKP